MIGPINAIANAWWSSAVSMFWQAGLLIVVIGCIDLLIRRWAWPQLRYALWSLILIKLLLPPTLSLPTGLTPRLAPWAAQISRTASDPGVGHGVAVPARKAAWAKAHPTTTLGLSPAVREDLLADGEVRSEASEFRLSTIVVERSPMEALAAGDVDTIQPAGPRLTWQAYALCLWIVGALTLGAFLVARLCSLSRGVSIASAEPSVPRSFYNQMRQCADLLGLRRLPRVASTERLSSPAVFGVVRPVLLVPVGYLSRLSRQDVEHMLLHELAHIKRGDLWMHGLYLLLQTFYWYNPLLWLVRRQVHHLRELCCDATVAGLLREGTPAYRQTLLDVARRFLAVRSEPGLGLLGLFEDSNLLLTRLNWLEKPTWRYRRMKRAIVVTLVVLMFACVLPMAQAQPEPPSKPSGTTVAHSTAASAPSGTTMTHQGSDQFVQQMDRLKQQMEQLRQQMEQLAQQREQLAKQMAELSIESANMARHAAAEVPVVPHVPQLTDALPHVPHSPAAPVPHVSTQGLGKAEAVVEGEYAVKSVKPETVLEIRNEVGSITITGGNRSDCTIKTIVKAKAATQEQAEEMARKVQIRVTPTDGVVRIGADLPEGLRNQDGEGIQVSFELVVPEQVRLKIAQEVGDIHLTSLAGDVEARTNVGAIHASGLKAGASLRTNVGAIDLAVPADASAKVSARTQVGAITSDLPLDMTGTVVLKGGDVKASLGSSATGVLGDGKHKLDLQTQVGVIKIRSEASQVRP